MREYFSLFITYLGLVANSTLIFSSFTTFSLQTDESPTVTRIETPDRERDSKFENII